jgi:hypothetical protein
MRFDRHPRLARTFQYPATEAKTTSNLFRKLRQPVRRAIDLRLNATGVLGEISKLERLNPIGNQFAPKIHFNLCRRRR